MSFETFPYEPSALGNFVLGQSVLGYTVTGTLTDIIPAYLYQQYADDVDLQAFFSALNSLSQGYLDWFNQYPLSLYTDNNISGLLLDWVGQGLYSAYRPVISTSSINEYGPYSTTAYGSLSPYSVLTINESVTAVVANDDIYKRLLTWNLYLNDGKQASITWLRRRVARFLYGENGSDVSPDDYLDVGISFTSTYAVQGYARVPYASMDAPYSATTLDTVSTKLNITIPNDYMGQTFQILFEQGILQAPFQIQYTVTLV